MTSPSGLHPDPLKGILFKVAGTLFVAIVGAEAKALGAHYPLGEIVFARSFFMLGPVLVFAWFDPSGLAVLKTRRLTAHLRRSFAGALGLTTTFGTLLLLPYADATALSFSAPLVLVALAAPLLGERIGPYRIGAVVIGFIGVLLIVEPHATGASGSPHAVLGVALGILSAFGVALAQLAIRALRDEPAMTTVFYFGMILSAGSLLTLPFGWQWPRSSIDALLLVSIGLVGGFAQLSITHSYRFADASVLAPYDYLQLLWAVALGYALFGETPLPIVLLGASIVAAAGIFIALRERTLLRRGVPVKEHTAAPTV